MRFGIDPCIIAVPYQGTLNVLHSTCTNFIKLMKLGCASAIKKKILFVLRSAFTNF